MSNGSNAVPQSAKPPATPPASKPKTAPRALDETDAVPVRRLMFRESVDVPGEQGVRALTNTERSGKPSYQILWLPRVNVYLVRASELRGGGVRQLMQTFTIPEAWAIADLDL